LVSRYVSRGFVPRCFVRFIAPLQTLRSYAGGSHEHRAVRLLVSPGADARASHSGVGGGEIEAGALSAAW
jgi:hypothetical protein